MLFLTKISSCVFSHKKLIHTFILHTLTQILGGGVGSICIFIIRHMRQWTNKGKNTMLSWCRYICTNLTTPCSTCDEHIPDIQKTQKRETEGGNTIGSSNCREKKDLKKTTGKKQVLRLFMPQTQWGIQGVGSQLYWWLT